MSKLAFISYRRDDTSQIAQALYLQLKEAFGPGQIFMDVHSIRTGESWPTRLNQTLGDAAVLLLLMGPGWLFARDQYGRRRIDDDDDWVRNEILAAMQTPIPIIPIVLDEEKNRPSEEALPQELKALASMEAEVLRTRMWAKDVMWLRGILKQHGLNPVPEPVKPVPDPKKSKTPALTANQLAEELKKLRTWDAWTDTLPFEYPADRHELRRTFVFENFAEAMAFMASLVKTFEDAQHHPLWENSWNVVRIRLTTWDAGNKITRFDVDMARKIDKKYKEFKARKGR